MQSSLLPQVLIPFDRSEALTVGEAAHIAMRSVGTMRDWANRYDLGRRIGGQWYVSHPALLMHLDGHATALAAYHRGDREGAEVRAYFARSAQNHPKR